MISYYTSHWFFWNKRWDFNKWARNFTIIS